VAEALARGSRITGTKRAELATELGQRYSAGESIRAIAEDTGRSFGFVHGLVKESGVDLRSRGGATRGPAARAAKARARAVTEEPPAPVAPAKAAPPGTGHEKGAKAGPKPKAKVEAAKTETKAVAKAKDKLKDKKPGKKSKR
jgi:hypothetical protein